MTPAIDDIQLLFCDLQQSIVAHSKTVNPDRISAAVAALA